MHEDIPGIDPWMALYRLNVDSALRPVKQKKNKKFSSKVKSSNCRRGREIVGSWFYKGRPLSQLVGKCGNGVETE